jgi:Ca2+-binding RTX toxin-like protein
VIRLEPGTYGTIHLRNLKFGDVTVESRDAANPAVLTGLLVRDSSGLNFRNLEFFVNPKDAVRAFEVSGSKDVHFTGLKVHGSIDGNPQNDGSGLMIRDSQDVSVTHSEFFELRFGIEQLDNKKLVISNNSFHHIREDGIRGGGSSDVLVSRNHFTDFFPVAGDHPDAIQFWTGNTTASAKNITIDENVILRGSGAPVQGIFFRDQVEKLPYQNVIITDNLVIGMGGNGIYANGVNHLKILNNVVESLPGGKSWIRTDDVKSGEVRGNTALLYLEEGSRGSGAGNLVNDYSKDGGKAALEKWSASFGTVGQGGSGGKSAPAGDKDAVYLAGTSGKDRLAATHDPRGTALNGGLGDDQLRGGKHADILVGGHGDDLLTGGTGADQFRFFGTQIDGASDRDRITDLSFAQGDVLVFGSFAAGTFSDAAGVNAWGDGSAASISSYAGIVKSAAASDKVTAFREAAGSGNLVLRVIDADGQVQDVVLQGGYAQYLAAGGIDGL